MMPILALNGIHIYYGNLHIIKGISLSVGQGEIVTLIGSNGAGKSTTLKAISGLLKPRDGNIIFNEERIDKLPPYRIVMKGISQAPEGRKIFTRLTVMENLEMGAYARNDPGIIKEDIEKVFSLFPRLKERKNQIAGTLSGGEQQMLSMGRALMSRPKILLLDEPSMGLAPILVEAIFDIILDINRQGTTILLVEQNALMALSIATRGYVLETGSIVLEGRTPELKGDQRVQAAYLGEIE